MNENKQTKTTTTEDRACAHPSHAGMRQSGGWVQQGGVAPMMLARGSAAEDVQGKERGADIEFNKYIDTKLK